MAIAFYRTPIYQLQFIKSLCSPGAAPFRVPSTIPPRCVRHRVREAGLESVRSSCLRPTRLIICRQF